MSQTLMSGWEVVKYSPLGSKFPPTKITPHIRRKEQLLKKNFLGDYYDLLVKGMVYNGVVASFDSSVTYSQGDIIDYAGEILISLVNTNNTEPCEDKLFAFWQKQDKFNDACYQAVWPYIRNYIAYVCASASLSSATFNLSADGVTRKYVEKTGQQTGGVRELGISKDDMEGAAQEEMELLMDYVKNDNSSCDYSQMKFMIDNGCLDSSDQFEMNRSGRKFFWSDES